ncbi:hypothetical protein RB614_31620 [Phytohabitans sp. ZYX-F-186]|uniref:Uncharacterized protein n=1 Tax=Phytohabitans maris TaxID=3071409 RepID=A0ABU0ZQP0_9ACTN|nr:hypothetical protein [Phytohabitans sp. ZYX-F-186]MDQ7909081.1 hypothetical protein [Phytohabitans sp. ZYX-F-186]
MANFLPVRFRGRDAFYAGVVPFESGDQLDALRAELRGSYVVAREGHRVVCAPLTDGTNEIGEQEEFVLREHKGLAMRLLREALIREVIAMRYQLRSVRPPDVRVPVLPAGPSRPGRG